MSVSELPIASAVYDVLASRGANRLSETGDDDSAVSSVEEVDITAVLAAAKSLSASELFKVIKECTKEAEKRMKTVEKSTPAKRQVKKAKDAPKKKTPHQLRKNNAWVTFTREHARNNGWESFTVKHEIKDSDKKVISDEVVEMPASVLYNGVYIYEGSINEKTPDGRQIIHKEAMSLSKQRKGTHPSWDEFLASYEEAASETESVAKSTTSSKVTVRKTAAEKEAERAEKAAAKEAEKAEKAAEREAKKAATAAKKAAEDAAKAERKAEREAKKADKEAEAAKAKASKKAPAKKVVKAADAPKAATTSLKAASAPKAAGGAGAVAKRPVVEEEWVAPKEEGAVKVWSYKGKTYLRNAENEIWLKAADGGVGEWQGVYLTAENRIDDSIPEPVFEEEE
jgi:hypothetical protein